MSELDAFEARVRQNIKLLSASDARTRRKAAAWLGEAGDPSAITRLKQVYDEDPDAGVRQAASYSLGMFRALEREMAGEDSDRVYDLLEDIALRGKMGRRLPVRTGCLVRLIVALLVSLAILLAFNFVIWPQYQDQILDRLGIEIEHDSPRSGIPDAAAPAGRKAVLADLDALLGALRADATTLQGQYQNLAALDCQVAFKNPIAYNVAAIGSEADLSDLASRLNVQLVQLVTAKAPYNQACASGSPALTDAEVAAPKATLDTILAELIAIEATLNAARS